jgi:hypothetical protein
MRMGRMPALALGLAIGVWTLFAWQNPFREYPGWEDNEYNRTAPPPDWREPAEWTFARLMYPTTPLVIDWQSEQRRGFDWRQGRTNWTIDYPRSDRHLELAVRRLTRIAARSVEQPINIEADDDVFNYPWLYAVEAGHWDLSPEQIRKFREYLLRGGFFMCDDFHGTDEWNVFMSVMEKVFPDRPVVDIEDSDPIFHTVFDLDDRYQVPGAQFLETRSICEKCASNPRYGSGGDVPHWRGVYDDKGRLMVAICHNMDLGDSWENADVPRYPEKFSALGIRIGIDYLVYSMTH